METPEEILLLAYRVVKMGEIVLLIFFAFGAQVYKPFLVRCPANVRCTMQKFYGLGILMYDAMSSFSPLITSFNSFNCLHISREPN